MVQGLLGRKDRNASNGNGHNSDSTFQNGGHQNNYVDYLAEARKHLGVVEEFSDEQSYQIGMLNALIGVGYELRKINKYNRSNQ
jgi:hypothetical protein|tara:strand:+ start:13195 stop:13446 length:252 start_codon:yes stop_codon:yes gene_type:complete